MRVQTGMEATFDSWLADCGNFYVHFKNSKARYSYVHTLTLGRNMVTLLSKM